MVSTTVFGTVRLSSILSSEANIICNNYSVKGNDKNRQIY